MSMHTFVAIRCSHEPSRPRPSNCAWFRKRAVASPGPRLRPPTASRARVCSVGSKPHGDARGRRRVDVPGPSCAMLIAALAQFAQRQAPPSTGDQLPHFDARVAERGGVPAAVVRREPVVTIVAGAVPASSDGTGQASENSGRTSICLDTMASRQSRASTASRPPAPRRRVTADDELFGICSELPACSAASRASAPSYPAALPPSLRPELQHGCRGGRTELATERVACIAAVNQMTNEVPPAVLPRVMAGIRALGAASRRTAISVLQPTSSVSLARNATQKWKGQSRNAVVHDRHHRRNAGGHTCRVPEHEHLLPFPTGPRRHRAAPSASVRCGRGGAQLRPARNDWTSLSRR